MRWAGAVLWMLFVGGVAEAAPADPPVLVGPDGSPVAEARVEVVSRPRTGGLVASVSAPTWAGVTDPEGRIGLDLPRGRELLVLVDHPPFAPLVVTAKAPLPAVLRLEPGASLEGRVVSPEPVPEKGEACVRWRQTVADWERRFEWERCAELEDDGGFRVPGVPPGRVDVAVTAEGFLPASVVREPGRLLEISLERGVLVRGTVRSAAGKPVPGATVRHGGRVVTTTDERGGYEAPVPSLPASLEFAGEGFSSATRRVAKIHAERPLDVELPPTQLLTGYVVDRGGAEVGEVVVVLRRHSVDGSVRRSRHPMELIEGELVLAVEPPGSYSLSLRVPGRRELRVPPVEVGAGEQVDLGVLELSAGAVVRGSLLDHRSGQGVDAALVTVRPRGERFFVHLAEGRGFDAVSSEDGGFELSGLEPGDYELVVEAEGYAPWRLAIDLAADEPLDLGEIHLDPGTRVHGRVVDRRGEPVAGATVLFLDPERASLVPLADRTTSEEGEFSEVALMEGRYAVEITRERLLSSQPIDVPDGEEYELELVAGGVELHGVVSRSGEPVAGGAVVLASELDPGLNGAGKVILKGGDGMVSGPRVFGLARSSASATVRGDGTFTVEDAPAGAVAVTYHPPAGSAVERTIEIPDRAAAWVEIDVTGIELLGTVTDRETGAGVTARVRLVAPSGRPLAASGTDPNGAFRLRDVEPGVYAVRAEAEGYRPQRIERVEVRPDMSPLGLTLVRSDTGSLDVTLRRTDGTPVAGVFASLVDELGATVRSLLTDASGRRRYEDLAAGRYHVVWSDAGTGVGVSPPLEVRPQETTRWEEALPAGTSLRLSCDPDLCAGLLLERLLVFSQETGVEIARFLRGAASERRFTADGRLSIGSLSPGRYVVQAVVRGTARVLHVELPPAGTVELPLGLGTESAAHDAAGGAAPGRP